MGVLAVAGDIADLGKPMLDLLASGGIALAGAGRRWRAERRSPPPRDASKRRCRARAKCSLSDSTTSDHAEESGQPIPQRPVVFAKMPGCIVGPGHPVYMPRASRAVDWEAELCFVIGKAARYVSAADAEKYVAGYCCGNDVSSATGSSTHRRG